jgi:outer membrane protein TolC
MVTTNAILVGVLLCAAGEVPELTLSDALAELERQNLTLAQARARADEAEAIAREAAAPLLPSVAATGSYTRNRDELALGLPGQPARLIQPLEAWTATGAARLGFSLQSWFDLGAARGGSRAARAGVEATRREVRAAFETAAYRLLGIEELVRASEEAVASANELARSAERRRAAGTAPPLDLLRAQTEQVRRESDLARARSDLEGARLALGVLLGRPGPVRVVVPEVEASPPTPWPSPPVLVEEALARRPEISAQRALVEAAESQVRSANARLVPQLSASAAHSVQDVPFPTGEDVSWRMGLDLTWTLYDGGFRYGKRREASAALERARAAAEAQRLAVVQEVSDGVRELEVARERLRLAVKQQQLAADAAGTARRGYAAGIASSLEVIDANDELYLAGVGLAVSRARLAGARIALARALGRDG